MSKYFNHSATTALRHFDRSVRVRGLRPTIEMTSRILMQEGFAGITRRLDAFGTLEPTRKGHEAASAIILTTPHLLHFAKRLRQVLSEVGISAQISDDDRAARRFDWIFAFAPQNFPAAPPAQTIAFQVEQSVMSERWTSQYLRKLSDYRAVLEYSPVNITAMQDHVPLQKIFYVPFSPLSITRSPQRRSPRVLFYGDLSSKRRAEILPQIQAHVPELEVVTNLFGDALESRLSETDIVLNLHAQQGGLLETARISEALSFGCRVVSETAPDQALHDMPADVVFAAEGDATALSSALRRLIDDTSPEMNPRPDIQPIRTDMFRIGLLRAFQGLRIISPELFEQLSAGYPAPATRMDSGMARICLTLPETPARSQAFQGQKYAHSYQHWPGMKATPGWRGAALSYRHIMRRLRDDGINEALVVEDDVILPDDFDRRLHSIRQYMDASGADMFSGLIIDLHKDARVLDVEHRDGICLVQLDRAVMMICNLYRKRMIDYLADWDDQDDNVFSNTIDRYMERAGDMRIVTTLPFTAGYGRSLRSTLRDEDNSRLDAMLLRSEAMLAERVAAFQSAYSLRSRDSCVRVGPVAFRQSP